MSRPTSFVAPAVRSSWSGGPWSCSCSWSIGAASWSPATDRQTVWGPTSFSTSTTASTPPSPRSASRSGRPGRRPSSRRFRAGLPVHREVTAPRGERPLQSSRFFQPDRCAGVGPGHGGFFGLAAAGGRRTAALAAVGSGVRHPSLAGRAAREPDRRSARTTRRWHDRRLDADLAQIGSLGDLANVGRALQGMRKPSVDRPRARRRCHHRRHGGAIGRPCAHHRQLIHAARDRHLWAHSYERRRRCPDDAGGDRAAIAPPPKAAGASAEARNSTHGRLSTRWPENPGAHDDYLSSRHSPGAAHGRAGVTKSHRLISRAPSKGRPVSPGPTQDMPMPQLRSAQPAGGFRHEARSAISAHDRPRSDVPLAHVYLADLLAELARFEEAITSGSERRLAGVSTADVGERDGLPRGASRGRSERLLAEEPGARAQGAGRQAIATTVSGRRQRLRTRG